MAHSYSVAESAAAAVVREVAKEAALGVVATGVPTAEVAMVEAQGISPVQDKPLARGRMPARRRESCAQSCSTR